MTDLNIPYTSEEIDDLQNWAQEKENATSSVVQFNEENQEPLVTCFKDLGSKNLYLSVLNDKFLTTNYKNDRKKVSKDFVKLAKSLIGTDHFLDKPGARNLLLNFSKEKHTRMLLFQHLRGG